MSDKPSIEAYDAFIACLSDSLHEVLRNIPLERGYSTEASFYESLKEAVNVRIDHDPGHALHIEDKEGLRDLWKKFQES